MIFAILCYSSTVILCSSEVQDYKYISIKLLTNLDQPCPYTEPCLTLEQFSENASQYYGNTSLTLEFLPGDHWLASPVTVHNVSNLTLFSQTTDANIICSSHFAYIELTDITIAQLTHLTFLGCGPGDIYVTRALAALDIFSVSDLNIRECKFHNSKGRVVDAMFCNITIYKSEFINSSITALHIYFRIGSLSIRECKFHDSKGRVITGRHCNITIYKSEFVNSSKAVLFTHECNVSDIGSFYYNSSNFVINSVVTSYSSVLKFSSCKFDHSSDLFWAVSTTVILHLSELINSRAYFNVFYAQNSTIRIESSCIKGNRVRTDVFDIFQSYASLKNTTILGNTAPNGQVLSARESTLQLESHGLQDILIAANKGQNIISFSESQVNITGKLMFINNSGTFLIRNSNVRFFNVTTFQSCTGSATTSMAKFVHAEGGAVTTMGSKVWFYDSVMFLNNSSNDVGGGLCAYGSKVYIVKSIQMGKNQAKKRGGGIFLYRSSFICAKLCNISENRPRVTNGKSRFKGGGIYAFDSKIILLNRSKCTKCVNNVLFIIKDNFATEGGGMYLEANSML